MSGKLEQFSEQNARARRDCAAQGRLEKLFDEGSFVETGVFAKSGENQAAVITGYGTVDGSVVYAFSQDSSVMNGAVTRAHAEKIRKIYDLAAKTGCPVVGFYDSMGAKIDDSNESLYAYGEMLLWSNNLSGVVPQISVVMGTCSSSAAMVACSADVVIMKQGAEFFMNPPFILKAKGEKVEGAGTADNAAKAGTAQIVVEDEEAALEQVRGLIALLPLNNLSAVPYAEFEEPADPATLDALCEEMEQGYDVYSLIGAVVDENSFFELSAAHAKGMVTGFATLAGQTVGIVATNKKENDTITKCAAAKAARFVRLCDSFSVSVISFVDTEGFAVCGEAEVSGGVKQAAKLAHAYAEATCVKLAVITASAVGPAFIALAGKNANSDLTFAWPGAVISAISPKAAAAVLYDGEFNENLDAAGNDAAKLAKYRDTVASPYTAAQGGYIDNVIAPSATRYELIRALDALQGKRVTKMPKKHGNIQM